MSLRSSDKTEMLHRRLHFGLSNGGVVQVDSVVTMYSDEQELSWEV